MGGRQGGSRRARSNVTYNEDELSEMSRPVYLDWRGCASTTNIERCCALSSHLTLASCVRGVCVAGVCRDAGQDPTESGNDYRDRQSRNSDTSAAGPAKKKGRRR